MKRFVVGLLLLVVSIGVAWADPPYTRRVMNRAKLLDAVDLVWRNRVGEIYNINDDLGRIQARTLVMHITNDNWLNFKLAERAVDRIPGADLISKESPVAHYAVFSIINHRKNDPKFVAFMDDVKYATAKDDQGTSWQIGYMDEYAGTDKNPKVLVIIHGKGAFAGNYGNILQYALRMGPRVGLAKGNPKELQQWANEFIYDIYGMVSELQLTRAGE